MFADVLSYAGHREEVQLQKTIKGLQNTEWQGDKMAD